MEGVFVRKEREEDEEAEIQEGRLSISHRPPLIVDPEQVFLETLRQDPLASHVKPELADNGKIAQALLGDPNRPLSGVFVNLATQNTHGASVIRFAHAHRPALPVFVIHNSDAIPTESEIRSLQVIKAVPKPITLSQIIELLAPTARGFDSELTIDSAKKKSTDQVGQEVTESDVKFVPIRADDFLSGSQCAFDLYVQLPSNRYLKLLQAGESFDPKRLETFLSKGVTHFYIRKDSQERYLAFCDTVATSLLKSQRATVDLRVSHTLNHGQETLSFLKNYGLSETSLGYVTHYIDNLSDLVKTLNTNPDAQLSGFLADLAGYEHGVSASMLASLLIKPLDIQSSQALRVVGVATLLHDIGLSQLPPETRDEDESKMSKEVLAQYHQHPIIGAESLRPVPGIEPAAIQAVAQHHERRNKKGFPSRVGAGHINRIAEIVGICDEFSRLIKRATTDPSIHPLKVMELMVFDGFSVAVVGAFRSTFCAQRPGARKAA